MTTELEDLTEHLARHFTTYSGALGEAIGPQGARVFAALAISGIGTFVDGPWTLIKDGEHVAGELMTVDDGISDGISRFQLLALLSMEDDAGQETQARYRGVEISIAYGLGDSYLMLDDVDGSPSFHVKNSSYGGGPAAVLRDVDTWIDAYRARDDA